MELSELQQRVDTWIKEYGVRYFSELTNMAVLTEEVGELARVMARKYGDQSFKAGEKENLADEMADVLWSKRISPRRAPATRSVIGTTRNCRFRDTAAGFGRSFQAVGDYPFGCRRPIVYTLRRTILAE